MDIKILISPVDPVDPAKPSPLLRLPNELLGIIFSEIWVAELSPICRRVYPFQQKQLYEDRIITIRSYKALAALCTTVHGSSFIGSLITHLQLNMHGSAPNMALCEAALAAGVENGTQSAEAQPARDEAVKGDERREIVKPKTLFNLLARLSRLVSLGLYWIDSALLNVLLFNSEGVLAFPHLYNLSFSTDKISTPNGGDDNGDWVRHLARLPQLGSLDIQQSAQSSPLPPIQPPLPLFASLTSLGLRGRELGSSSGPALADLAPHVVELRLESLESAPACASILRTAPSGLRHLFLCSPLGRPTQARPGCLLDDVLPRFSRIRELQLCAHSYTPELLAPYLASLRKLRFLRFDWQARPTDDLLHDLFVGSTSPHRLRHLRTLELDHAWDYRGSSIEGRGWKFPAGATSALDGLDNSWHPAFWPAGCSTNGVKAAVAAARAAGIEVDGLGVRAASWGEAYERERTQRLLAWGIQTGDWDEAREELGDLTVELLIAEIQMQRAYPGWR